jgi:hypothetical protein
MHKTSTKISKAATINIYQDANFLSLPKLKTWWCFIHDEIQTKTHAENK